MIVRLPFTGTVLNDNDGATPTFDPADRMRIVDDVLRGSAYRVNLRSIDIDEGTVEVEIVEVRRRLKVTVDSVEYWDDEFPPGLFDGWSVETHGDRISVTGGETPDEFTARAMGLLAAIDGDVKAKTPDQLRSESVNYSGLRLTDSQPQEQKDRLSDTEGEPL